MITHASEATHPFQRTWRAPTSALVATLAFATIGAEVVAALGYALAAAVVDAAVIAAAVNRFVLADSPEGDVFAALTLVPLLRLASITMAVEEPVVSLCASGTPILVGTVLAARALRLGSWARPLDLKRRSQWSVGLAGLPAGAVAALVTGPQPLVPEASWAAALGAGLAVFTFAGVLEELLFRGVLQPALGPLGGWAVPSSSLLFTSVYLDAGSVMTAVTAAVGGLAAGWWVARTGTVAGVAMAHGLFASGYLVVWPLLF